MITNCSCSRNEKTNVDVKKVEEIENISTEKKNQQTEQIQEVEISTEESEEVTTGALKEFKYEDEQKISLDLSWEFADKSKVNSGQSTIYLSKKNRKNIIVGINAGHGTKGGSEVKTLCHPDGSPKVTGGTTKSGSIEAYAVSSGMDFNDGTPEHKITFRMANILKDKLLDNGYDVLMIRDDEDVQLDNVARTVICNNIADCHIALHWDGDECSYDKGCYYIGVPDGIKDMYPVNEIWEEDEKIGRLLIEGLESINYPIFNSGRLEVDLTQTSYSIIPSVDIELGNQCSEHDDNTLSRLADGLIIGINRYFMK